MNTPLEEGIKTKNIKHNMSGAFVNDFNLHLLS
jgi:hypothetical protein